MKPNILYTVLLAILCLLLYPYNSIAKEFIGKVIKVDKKQTQIQVEIYNTNSGFSWYRLFGFNNAQKQTPKILTIKLTNENINKISIGNFVRIKGHLKTNKEFILNSLEILPKDPTGVRERLGLIRRQRKGASHRTRPHIMHTHRPVGMRQHPGGRHR